MLQNCSRDETLSRFHRSSVSGRPEKRKRWAATGCEVDEYECRVAFRQTLLDFGIRQKACPDDRAGEVQTHPTKKAPRRQARGQRVDSGREAMGVSFDKIDGVIWYDGKLVRGRRPVHVLTHGLHYASAVFEGERAYGGRVFKSRNTPPAAEAVGQHPHFEIPYSAARSTPAKPVVIDSNNLPTSMSARSPGAARK